MATGQENRHPLIAGALTGAAEVIITYPLQYLKTIQQISGMGPRPASVAAGSSATSATTAPTAAQPTNMLGFARHTYRSFGLRGFYRGLSSNLVFALPRRCAYNVIAQ
jgi:hypothetical protein